jgi:hypothetical protein
MEDFAAPMDLLARGLVLITYYLPVIVGLLL